MSRPRKTNETLATNGAFEHDPKRAEGRSLEADAEALGMSDAEIPEANPVLKEAWDEIVTRAEPGLLKSHHFLAVRSGARLLAKENLESITAPERAQLWKFFEQFGMTARSRAYVSVKEPKKSNEFGDL